MSEKLELIKKQLQELDKAPLLAQPAAAKRAVHTAVALIAEQANAINVLRARLDNVEARAADAIGRVVKMEGQKNAA